MKILITGPEGFIAQNLSTYLISCGHKVEGYTYKENTLPDPTDYDWVIHLGAISSTTETDVEKVLKQNYEFTMNLIQICDQLGVNIQLASSASVYGPGLDGFREDSKCLPKSPYAWSKYLIDRFLTEAGIYNKEFNVLIQSFRYFNVYGPGEEHKGNQASPIYKFTQQAKNEGIINLFENSGNYDRDFIFVGDVCKIQEKMLHQDTSGIFNIGTGQTESFLTIAQSIAKKYDASVKVVPMPENLRGQYQEHTCADLTNLNKHVKIEFTKVGDYINAK